MNDLKNIPIDKNKSLEDGGEKTTWYIDAHRLCNELEIPQDVLGIRLKKAILKVNQTKL